jgi:cation:H+ antiporter
MFLSFGILILLCLLMGFSTRVVLGAFDKMAVGMTTKGKIAAASILVALSTSLPELFVTLASVVEKKPEIALGTLLGSNVADLSIIIGGATLLAGSLPIVGEYWRFELAAAFVAGISPILLMMDGGLSRMDGAILIVIYIIYLSDLIIGGKKKVMLFQTGKKKLVDHGIPIIEMVLGIIILLVSGNWLVKIGGVTAREWGVPVGVVGLLVISVGTSLPELFLSAGAIMKRNMALVLGNILGSVVTNATLIIGVLAFFHPFSVERTGSYALVNIAFVVIFGLFWMFTSTKRKLERREGLILVGVFVTFVGLVLLFPSI